MISCCECDRGYHGYCLTGTTPGYQPTNFPDDWVCEICRQQDACLPPNTAAPAIHWTTEHATREKNSRKQGQNRAFFSPSSPPVNPVPSPPPFQRHILFLFYNLSSKAFRRVKRVKGLAECCKYPSRLNRLSYINMQCLPKHTPKHTHEHYRNLANLTSPPNNPASLTLAPWA